MFVTCNLLRFGGFTTREHVDGCFLFVHCNIYIIDCLHTKDLQVNYHVYASLWKQCHFLRPPSLLISLFSFTRVATERTTRLVG